MSAGRPARYKTIEELQEMIDLYFEENEEYPTITGLALFLGFESRQSFYDYEKVKKFSYTIKKARLQVENSYEISLRKNGRSGDIFALKNFGWRDNQNIDLTSDGEKLPISVNINGKKS